MFFFHLSALSNKCHCRVEGESGKVFDARHILLAKCQHGFEEGLAKHARGSHDSSEGEAHMWCGMEVYLLLSYRLAQGEAAVISRCIFVFSASWHLLAHCAHKWRIIPQESKVKQSLTCWQMSGSLALYIETG